MDREAGEEMRLEKKTRPSWQANGRGHQDQKIVTDFKPFAAFYIITALTVAYAIGCFARDMGWLQ